MIPMAAIFIPTEQLRIPEHLRARTPATSRPAHLQLVGVRATPAVQGGTDDTAPTGVVRSAWLFRMALAVVAVAAVVGMNAVLDPVESPTVPAAPVVVEPVAVAAPVHVVQPGETLWSIAAQVAPGADLRPVVDELARRAGGSSLQPGQRIAIDGLSR